MPSQPCTYHVGGKHSAVSDMSLPTWTCDGVRAHHGMSRLCNEASVNMAHARPRSWSKRWGSLFQNVRPRKDPCLLKSREQFKAETLQLLATNLHSLASAAFRKWQIHGPLAQHQCRWTSLVIGELAAVLAEQRRTTTKREKH